MASSGIVSEPATPRTYDIREGDSRRDLFYLRWQLEHYFGTDCETPEQLLHHLAIVMGWIDEDEQTPLAVSTPVAEHTGVHIGGGIATIEDHESTVETLPDGGFDAGALAGERSAWLWFGVVDPAWRGHGIGRDLFRYRLSWAQAQGADMVFGIGWERDGPGSRPLFDGFGFVPVQRFEDYYVREGERSSCPDCGVWEGDDCQCQCAGTLWALDGGDIGGRKA